MATYAGVREKNTSNAISYVMFALVKTLNTKCLAHQGGTTRSNEPNTNGLPAMLSAYMGVPHGTSSANQSSSGQHVPATSTT